MSSTVSGAAAAAATAGDLAQQMYEMQLADHAVAGHASFYAAARQQCQQGLVGSLDNGLLATAAAMQQQQHQFEQEEQLRQQQRQTHSCPLPSLVDRQFAGMNSRSALLAPVSEETHAAAAQRERLAVEAIDEELLMMMQVWCCLLYTKVVSSLCSVCISWLSLLCSSACVNMAASRQWVSRCLWVQQQRGCMALY
jgi:hypothetical protein